jgi:hypothetical protein
VNAVKGIISVLLHSTPSVCPENIGMGDVTHVPIDCLGLSPLGILRPVTGAGSYLIA